MPPISYSSLFPFAIGGFLVFLGVLLKPVSEDMKFAFFLSVGKMLMYIVGGTVSSVVARKILKAICDALKLRRATSSVAEKASYLVALCFMLAVVQATEKKATGGFQLSLLHVLAAILGIVQGEQLRFIFSRWVLFYAVGAVLILFRRVLFDEALDAARKATIFQIIGGKAFCWVILNASVAVLLYVESPQLMKSVAASLTQDTLWSKSRGGLLMFLGELLIPAPKDRKFAFFLSVGKRLMYIAGETVLILFMRVLIAGALDAARKATNFQIFGVILYALVAVLLNIERPQLLGYQDDDKTNESFCRVILTALVGFLCGERPQLMSYEGFSSDEGVEFVCPKQLCIRNCPKLKPGHLITLANCDKLLMFGDNESGKSVAASLTQDTLGNESRDLFKTRTQNIDGSKLIVKYAFGLTEPPDAREWHDADSIELSGNIFSNLPDEPVCPKLLKLFLRRNYKLRKISPAFFTNMPLLRTLDLSEAGIMSLPKSLFELPHLGELILKNCEFLMKLPPEVGKLKRLEVLDMEGTEIINLPIEIKELSLLRILRVSLYGCLDHDWKSMQSNAMIPFGVISALSKLEDIYIDVNPDDERWDACVERILKEVCGLTKLTCLGFYFPRVELLSCLKRPGTSMIYQSLAMFRFIVGDHSKRIISRLPSGFEDAVGVWGRSLKYINGEGVPEDITKVLQHATEFHLDRHMTAKKLTEFGIENMEHLQFCVLGECNEIQVIIDGNDVHKEYDKGQIVSESSGDGRIGLESLEFLHIYNMKNLKSIWKGPVRKMCLSHLMSLTLSTCPQLITIFTVELLENLHNLKYLIVRDCPAIKSLVIYEEAFKQSGNYLPNLRTISLHYVPELVTISSEVCIAPNLEVLSLYNCPKLKSLSMKEVSSKHLTKITGETDWWEALELTQVQRDKFGGIFASINADTLNNRPIGMPKDSLSKAQLQQSVDLDEKEQHFIEKKIQDGLRLKAKPESSKQPNAIPCPDKGEESFRPEIEQYPTFDRQKQFIYKCGLDNELSEGTRWGELADTGWGELVDFFRKMLII